ncbi:phosphopantetheine-binding protein [Streptomyces prunicolor]|uniref:phosphopantetheine-binding protein n=1 Tax=Streptomyces prunicolor TaxID=67348 RepID=UPI0034470624
MDNPWDDRFETVIRNQVPTLPDETALLPDLDLTAFGLSSLGIVQLLMQLEHAYGVELADEILDFRLFTNLGKLWAALSGCMATGSAPTPGQA